jgi:hypothetical protein
VVMAHKSSELTTEVMCQNFENSLNREMEF